MNLPADTRASREPSGPVAKWLHDLGESFKPILKAIAWAVGIVLTVSIAVAFYQGLDASGWIPHDHQTPVWIHGDWMVGEYRACQLRTTTSFPGNRSLGLPGIVLSQQARAELPRLFCGGEGGDGITQFQLAMPSFDAATESVWGEQDWRWFDDYFHVLPVRYNGRIERPDKWEDSWRCQRNTASLTCWALN